MSWFEQRRFVVTGGAGFLGHAVVEKLKARGAKHLMVPRSKDYDLVDRGAIKRLYDNAKPDVIVHLAARVGDIGANRENPGQFFIL